MCRSPEWRSKNWGQQKRGRLIPCLILLGAVISCSKGREPATPIGVIRSRPLRAEEQLPQHTPSADRSAFLLMTPLGSIQCLWREGVDPNPLIMSFAHGLEVERLIPRLLMQLSGAGLESASFGPIERSATAGDLILYTRDETQKLILLERAAPWLRPYGQLIGTCEQSYTFKHVLRQPVEVDNRPLDRLEIRLKHK